jgi:hypothetical protein|nr:MAG TPA: HNH endonuclease [Caudoviricetes sp.]
MEDTHSIKQTNQKQQGGRRVTCVLARLRAHYTTPANTKRKKRKKKKSEEKNRKAEKRVVLDGGGARLADAATRHHLTPTQKKRRTKRERAVSRTSTREHKQFRKQVLARAQAMGITHCPACGTKLQYNNNGQRKPNSAEADHIIPASLGGTNHPDNGRVLCAKCNSRRGNGRGSKGRTRHYQKNENERDRLPIAVMPTQHSNTW